MRFILPLLYNSLQLDERYTYKLEMCHLVDGHCQRKFSTCAVFTVCFRLVESESSIFLAHRCQKLD